MYRNLVKKCSFALSLFNSMNSGFSTNIEIFLTKMVSKLPFWFIYLMSAIFYRVVYYIIGYRKKVVLKNLRNSFPEKTENEIQAISKRFYHHFSDLTLETIKMNGMKDSDFKERMKVANAELINDYYDQGRSVMVLTMHYNNWEWGTYLSVYMKHKSLAVYKPLNDIRFDKFMNQTRSRFKIEMVKNEHILRHLVRNEKQKIPVFVWLAGDQTPIAAHDYWFRFLNQEAMFYPGPAVISKRFNQPVFFQRLEKTGRGKYLTTFELLCENPSEKSEKEIIKMYIDKMEKIIKEKPEFYLWSHNRWKRKRPEGVSLQK
jgi:Kdo2-lipid IVA lauroyltransferase/acyltransferase